MGANGFTACYEFLKHWLSLFLLVLMIRNGTLVRTEMVSKYLGLGKLHLEMRGRTARKASETRSSGAQMPEKTFWGRITLPSTRQVTLGRQPFPSAGSWPHLTVHQGPTFSLSFSVNLFRSRVRCCPLRFRRREARIEQTCSGLGRRKREHAVIRAVIITSLQAWSGSIEGGISRPSLTAAID